MKNTEHIISRDSEEAVAAFLGTMFNNKSMELMLFMQAFIGDMKPNEGSGVISSDVYWRYDDRSIKLIKEETSDGYHDLHDSVRSISLTSVDCNDTEFVKYIPYSENLDENSGSHWKTYSLMEPCEKVYAKTEKIWGKSYGCGWNSHAPGRAVFLVYNPPGLQGWYELEYEIYWD